MPVDDTHCYWYAIFTSFTGPVDKQQMRDQRLELYELPDYTSRKNKRNNYGYSVDEQLTETYTGMGDDINVHDQWAVESQGPIQDRTREHLGSDRQGHHRLPPHAGEGHREHAGRRRRADGDRRQAQASAMTGPPSIDGVGEKAGEGVGPRPTGSRPTANAA